MRQKISVAMCTYNGERFLTEQIDSILQQTRAVDEIIVCDDGSTDQTLFILHDYDIKNPGLFKIFENKINLRSVKNFEKAITICTGDIIFLSDQDDRWVVNKVEDFITYFKEHPAVQVLTSNGFVINDHSEILEKHTIWDAPKFLRENNRPFDFYGIISYISNVATGAAMAFRKEILPEILPFPTVTDFHHDEWIASISSRKNTFEMLDKKYIYYRIHDNQQVGGVSFDKNDRVKEKITKVFDYGNTDQDFTTYKRRLTNLVDSHKKNKKLAEDSNKYNSFFKENVVNIESLYHETRKLMAEKSFLMSIVLRISDKIRNKRQLIK